MLADVSRTQIYRQRAGQVRAKGTGRFWRDHPIANRRVGEFQAAAQANIRKGLFDQFLGVNGSGRSVSVASNNHVKTQKPQFP